MKESILAAKSYDFALRIKLYKYMADEHREYTFEADLAFRNIDRS